MKNLSSSNRNWRVIIVDFLIVTKKSIVLLLIRLPTTGKIRKKLQEEEKILQGLRRLLRRWKGKLSKGQTKSILIIVLSLVGFPKPPEWLPDPDAKNSDTSISILFMLLSGKYSKNINVNFSQKK